MDNFTFEPKTHTYALDGKKMTGVTTVLQVIAKPNLIQWAADMACDYIKGSLDIEKTQYSHQVQFKDEFDDVLAEARVAHRKKKEKAGAQGTDTHAQIEEYVKAAIKEGGELSGWMCANDAVASFVDWSIKNKIKFIESEKVMYSKDWFVGGTCDLVFEQEGKRYVGDIKTMKKMWDRVPYFQCAAYMKMLKETDKTKYDGSCIINIPKETNQVETFYSYDHESDLKAFEAALTLYRALQNEV